MKDNKTGIVIRAVDPDGVFWYYKLGHRSSWIKNLSEALIITKKEMSADEYEKLFEAANISAADGDYALKDIEMLDVVVGWCKSKKISKDDVDLIKQKVALSKLTREDIEALGIQDQAALHRLSDNINVSNKPTEDKDLNGPSMDDILSSIRNLLSEDENTTAGATLQKKTVNNQIHKQQSQRVLNQVEINSLLGFDEDAHVSCSPPKKTKNKKDDLNQDALAKAWNAAMGNEDEEEGADLAAEWAAMLDS